jgi:hypothetical protein
VAGAAVLPAIAIPAVAQYVLAHDPVFAAIEAYRTADAAFIARAMFEDDLAERGIELDPAADDYRTPEMVRVVKAAVAARTALAETAPTTLADLTAVFRFVREQSKDEFLFDGDEESTCFVATIERAVLGLRIG